MFWFASIMLRNCYFKLNVYYLVLVCLKDCFNVLKALFDPINPDKDTIQTRKWNRREKLDNEFWLLQRLEDILEKANFHELSDATLQRAIEEHDVSEGVRVW